MGQTRVKNGADERQNIGADERQFSFISVAWGVGWGAKRPPLALSPHRYEPGDV